MWLLEEMCHWVWDLRFQNSLISLPVDQNAKLSLQCHACLHTTLLPAMRITDPPSETVSQPLGQMLSFLRTALVIVSLHSDRTVTEAVVRTWRMGEWVFLLQPLLEPHLC